MKRIIMFFIVITTLNVSAQNMGIGLRLGDPTGLSFKKYLGTNAFEINIGRTNYFYRGSWYNKHFDYWYEKQKYNYTDIRYSGYRSYTPLGIQFHYLFQKPIADLEGLSWYFGPGAQFRFQRYRYSYWYKVPGDPNWYYQGEDAVTDIDLGLDLVIGLEYTFKDAPFSLFIDGNIFLEIIDHPFYAWGQGGLGGRFNF